jgi:multidrug efflux system membrane fusion protein
MPTQPRQLALLGGGLVLLLLLARGCWPQGDESKRKPAVLVSLATVQLGELDETFPITGEVKALASAAIRSQVSGVVQRVYFREGQDVVANQPLIGIDPSPWQAALNQAIANRNKAAAKEREAMAEVQRSKAEARLARQRANRYGSLGNQGAISLDQAEQFRSEALSLEATVHSRESEVQSTRADLQAARAAEASARLNLERTTIRSPIQGRAGQLRLTTGNLVRETEDRPLLVVNQFQPITVQFAVPQRLIPRLELGLKVRLASGDLGQVSSIDNAVDPSTGTTAVKATFANRSQHLVPGAYVKGSLELQRLHQVLLIPQVAIQTGQKGPFVYVAVGKVAKARQLQLGPSSGEQVVVRSGLAAGDQVVTKGQFALSPGALIRLAKNQPGPGSP